MIILDDGLTRAGISVKEYKYGTLTEDRSIDFFDSSEVSTWVVKKDDHFFVSDFKKIFNELYKWRDDVHPDWKIYVDWTLNYVSLM